MQFSTLAAAVVALALGGGRAAAQGTFVETDDKTPWPGSNHFPAFVVNMRPFVLARMDPIVDPGKISGHVHAVAGASNFRNVPNTPQEAQDAECTTCNFQADKSNYWYPELYYVRDDGQFEALATTVKIYYFGNGYNVQPFPQGMRAVVGTAMSRAPDFRQTVGWTCQTQGGRVGNGKFIPNGTTFPDGCNNIMLTVDFPSCGWANGSLDSWDHFSHLTYPIYQGSVTEYGKNPANMFCPPTHPVKYPQIRMEAFWETRESQPWRKDRPVYALSNGDTLGLSAHADYISNWDMDVQRQAISQCTYGRGTGEETSKECAPLVNSYNNSMSENCRHAGKIPAEDVGLHDPIKHLPGCNPLWTAEMGDAKPTDCPWYTGDPGWTAPNVYWVTRDPAKYFALPDAVLFPEDDNNMTIANLEKYRGTVYKGENTGLFYGRGGYFNGYGEYTNDEIMNWTDMFKFSNKVLVGTNKEVWDNRYGCNATDKTGTGPAAAMEDASHFTGVVPACTVDKSLWQDNLLKQPKNYQDTLAPGPIHPACGAVAKRVPKFPTNGFLSGPAVQVKDTPNDPSPYSTSYSFYASGYWPSDLNAIQWNRNEGKWDTTEDFTKPDANPAPGFDGTLKFSTPKPIKYSCADGAVTVDPPPAAGPAPNASAPNTSPPNASIPNASTPNASATDASATPRASADAPSGSAAPSAPQDLLMAEPIVTDVGGSASPKPPKTCKRHRRKRGHGTF